MTGKQNLEYIPPDLFRKKVMLSLVVPGSLVIILWLIRFIESQLGVSLVTLGIYPLELKGLPGIIFSPLIHEDISHLFNNTVPLLVLGSALFYFYSDVAFRVLILTWLATGLLVWLGGRPAWHIGASGIIYGLASFLFVSGVIRRYFRLMAVSLLVVFLYGSMVWGIFPLINRHVSWESHMLGAVTGVVLAVIYRKQGPVRPLPDWMLIEDDDEDEEFEITEEQIAGDDVIGDK